MGERAPIDGIAAAIAATEARDAMDGNLAVAIVHEVHTTRPYGGLTPRQLVAAEIGPALGLGSGAADKLLNHSLLLAERLPNTLGAVCAGQLSWHKATILAEATAPLTDEQTRLVEEQCLPKAA